MKIQIKDTKKQFTKPKEIAQIFQNILKFETNDHDRMKEHFWSIGFNNRQQIQYVELISLGTLTASLVHPREVFRPAITASVASIIIIHNHPSNNTEPSTDDNQITKQLKLASELLKIELLDHIIITENDFYSFKENNFF